MASKSRARKALLEEKRSVAPEPSFVVTTIEGQSLEVTKAALWKEVVKGNKAPKMSMITGKSGKVVLKSHDKETTDILKALKNKGLLAEEDHLKPRVIINGVPSEMDAKELADNVIGQNPELGLIGSKDPCFKPVFKKGARGRDTVSWVCEVCPELLKKLDATTLYVGFMSCRARVIEDITQCFACLGFGHSAQNCYEVNRPGYSITCAHCSHKGHREAECPLKESDPKCINCGGKHNARDKPCSRRSRALAHVLGRTNYQ